MPNTVPGVEEISSGTIDGQGGGLESGQKACEEQAALLRIQLEINGSSQGGQKELLLVEPTLSEEVLRGEQSAPCRRWGPTSSMARRRTAPAGRPDTLARTR